MFKKIVSGLAALILIFVAIVALQTSTYRVERMAKIAAPQADLFAQVNDFHKWDAWSPWAKIDPAAKVGFAGAESGQGAVMTWSGNDKVGEGNVIVVASLPRDHVEAKVDFVSPFEATTTRVFKFQAEGDQVAVTGTVSGADSFVGQALCLLVSDKKMR